MSARENIPQHWQEFSSYLGNVPGQVGNDSYGICSAANADSFDYVTAVEIEGQPNLPNGFTTLEVAPHRYAVFIHSGHISTIAQTISAIWQKWLPASGLQPANAPCYERYTKEYNPRTGMGGAEIWIPIQN